MMEVLKYPNDILKQKSAVVETVTDEEINQLKEMYDLMKGIQSKLNKMDEV
jgi:peptide deformylase